ncbi:MAG TPA: asparagine synthase-related protein [Ktedonobacteraceae bacterium]|jgi:asparagine synthase (glutamine-hydrolysing)
MQVGFVVLRRAHEIEVQINTPQQNPQPALVTYARAGDSFALLLGRLYYRKERLAQLQPGCPRTTFQECQTNDAALVLTTYRRLGRAALQRFEGDFALVVWDAETLRLIGLRDPLGGYPLFWAHHGGTFALSSSLPPLCALLPQRVLNEEYVAAFIMMQAPRDEGADEQCAYAGIERVLPGSMVIAGADSEQVEHHVYWDWLAHLVDPGTTDLTAVAVQYRLLLEAAIQERLCGRTLAHLSGGMDSTAIALLAHDLICSGVGEAPLHTASLVYERLPLLAQERPSIESVLQQETRIRGHRILADDLLDFDMFADPPVHDEPCPALVSYATQQPIAALAARIGARTLFTGHGADEIHHLLPYYLTDLLRQRRLHQAWQEATMWARARNVPPWSLLMTFGGGPLLSTWAAGSRWADLLTKKDADWSIPSWITPDFARRQHLRSRAIENARRIYQRCEHTALSVTLDAISSRAGDVFRWSVTTPLGIAHAHPFLDPRLLTFGLGMQLRILPDPGNMKPVLAEALRDRLPPAIRQRQRKRGFNEVYYLGLARNLPMLETMVHQAPLEEMIRKDLLIQYMQKASLAVLAPRALQHMNYTLSLMKWLGMQQDWHQRWERGVVIHRSAF